MTHPQSYTFDSPNSSTLTLSIVIPLRGFLAKSLPRHIHISEKIIWCLGSSSRENQFIWLMQWAYYGIRQVKEDKVMLNLVRARSLECLRASSRLGLEGLLLFMYLNWFSSGSFYHLEGVRERFFTVFFDFLFDNTCRYYLAFASLYPLLFKFNHYCVVIKLWLRVVYLFGYSLYLSFCTYIVWI